MTSTGRGDGSGSKATGRPLGVPREPEAAAPPQAWRRDEGIFLSGGGRANT